jgi:hypothetical protein
MICSQVFFLFIIELAFKIRCDTFVIVHQILHSSKRSFGALLYTSILETWFSYGWTGNIIISCCQTWVLKIYSKWHFWSTPKWTLMSFSKINRSNFSSNALLQPFRISTQLWNSTWNLIVWCSILDYWVYFRLWNIKMIDSCLILASRWFVLIQVSAFLNLSQLWTCRTLRVVSCRMLSHYKMWTFIK